MATTQKTRQHKVTIKIREAEGNDAAKICEIFRAVYDSHYAHQEYCNEETLKKILYDDSNLMFVAEDSESGRILGTASVILEIGDYGDMVGEFGRLVVHPDGRKQGIGKMLMEERLRHIKDRLQVGLVENRVAHPFSQKISAEFGFYSIGFLPQKLLFDKRESLALYARYFDGALKLRKNNPHLIPEACPLAQAVMNNIGLEPDVIADVESPAYPVCSDFELEEFKTQGYATLLRFEREQAPHREVFGPVQLHQGIFKLKATHSHYLLAKKEGRMAGAIGFTHDPVEKCANIFEIVTTDEHPVHHLLSELERKLREDLKVEYVEIDVSAYAPRMQRTLLNLGFLPVAYIPALAFQGAERLDALRMARLFVPLDIEGVQLYETSESVAHSVIHNLSTHEVSPHITRAIAESPLFDGLSDEQTNRLATVFKLEEFEKETLIFSKDEAGDRTYLILSGEVVVKADDEGIAPTTIGAGDCLSETSLIAAAPHITTAVTTKKTEAVMTITNDFEALIRHRADIGVVVYRNLAATLKNKLYKIDTDISKQVDSHP